MFINKVISFNSAWNMFNEKKSVYEDILQSITDINDDNLRLNSYKHHSNEINAISYHKTWDVLIQNLGWESYRIPSEIQNGIKIHIRNLKDGVASRMLAMNHMNMFLNWVLVETPKILNTEFCDLSILIVPMESEQEFYDDKKDGPNRFFFFEHSVAQLEEILPINHQGHFLIIGISRINKPIEIIELAPNDSLNTIERVLEFSKEHYQAGVGILSYFGEIIKQKFPDIDAKVRIEQDGNIVRMIVETYDGTREVIEKALEDYALIISNKAQPDLLFENPLQIHALTNKLAMAELEIRNNRDLMRISENLYNKKIESLEEDVLFLRQHVAQQMQHMQFSQTFITDQSKKEERLLLAQIDNSKLTVSDLINDVLNISDLKNALERINVFLEQGVTNENDETIVKQSLITVRDNTPDLFEDLSIALQNTMYGVSGNIVFQWLQQIVR